MMFYLLWATLLSNIGLAVFYCWKVLEHHRAIRRIVLLDQILTQIAIQSFANEHMPVWKAWSGVMGSFDVDFTVNRTIPKADG